MLVGFFEGLLGLLDDALDLVDTLLGLGGIRRQDRLALLGGIGVADGVYGPLFGVGGLAETVLDLLDHLAGHLIQRLVGLLDGRGNVQVGAPPDGLGLPPHRLRLGVSLGADP